MKRALFAIAIGLLMSAFASTAHACIPAMPDTLRRHTDVILQGRYFHNPDTRESGRIETIQVERGRRRATYAISWDLYELDDPLLSQCAVAPPADGSRFHFWLARLEDGTYRILRIYTLVGEEDEDD